MNGCLGFQVVIFLRILCQDVVIFAALFEDDAQIIYFENDWKEEDRPRRVKCRNPWCFETQKFRRSEKLRWCARLQDWRWTVRLQTFGTEKFQLMGLFWMDQTPPKNPVKEAVASPGYPVFLHPNTDAQVHKLQALRRLKPLSIHFCRVASLNILLCYFCLQGKQNWRLSSIFFQQSAAGCNVCIRNPSILPGGCLQLLGHLARVCHWAVFSRLEIVVQARQMGVS